MSETPLLRRLMLAFTGIGARLFRNQVGEGWYGNAIYNGTGSMFDVPIVTIKYPRKLSAGLCVGSSDLIGWHSVEITPEMVGRRVAIFVAVEAKSDNGRASDEQGNFLKAVSDAGGIALLVTGEDEIETAALQAKSWLPR